LADLDSVERRLANLQKKARGGDKESIAAIQVLEPVLEALKAGRPARSVDLGPGTAAKLRGQQLLSAKPVLYVCNVEEAAAATGNAQSARVEAMAAASGARAVVISAAIEAEVAQLGEADKQEFLAALGLAEPGLARVIRAGYALLGLITFLTVGPKEAHAWTIEAGTKAPQAAGTIHTDFERGFIASETIAYDDFVAYGGEAGVKEAGRMRLEGRDYVVRDGDILNFRFNV
ncbi:MAG: DUF933 domain-containing protein, partial [Alphaproteobacteria bacterium]